MSKPPAFSFGPKTLAVEDNMKTSPATKICINVGAGLDVPTGSFLPGKYGEYILNGGLPIVWGVTGNGNAWKSTTAEFLMWRAMGRIEGMMGTKASVHDTEENKQEFRITSMYQRMYEFRHRDLFQEGTIKISGKTMGYTDKWFADLKEFLDNKRTSAKANTVETPFIDRDRTNRIKILQPTFSLIDSFSEAETSDVAKVIEDTELGSKEGLTIYMKQGLSKTRLLMEYPTLGQANQHYLLTTTHFGKEGPQMGAGPYAPPPQKKMATMKAGDKIKGAPDKYFYLVHQLYHATGASLLITDQKGAEYPKETFDSERGNKDLWIVPLLMLRSKFGSSGWSHYLVASQTEGILPSLTEFHMLRESRFGLEGNLQNYALELMPDVKLSRTVVRKKLDADPVLRRAVNITSELYQMSIYHRGMWNLESPAKLAAMIKEQGYDLNMFLTKTRGWWKPDNEVHPLLFLSTYDFIRVAYGKYHPYWLEDDKKTIKPQYIIDVDYEFN